MSHRLRDAYVVFLCWFLYKWAIGDISLIGILLTALFGAIVIPLFWMAKNSPAIGKLIGITLISAPLWLLWMWKSTRWDGMLVFLAYFFISVLSVGVGKGLLDASRNDDSGLSEDETIEIIRRTTMEED
jgi:hypothetical protein